MVPRPASAPAALVRARAPRFVLRPAALAGVSALAVLAGCASAPSPPAAGSGPTARAPVAKPPVAAPAPAAGARRGGGYYMDDGPGAAPAPVVLAAIPDAEPRAEPLHRFANNPYVVFGRAYVPARELQSFRQRGTGSWYGRKFHGQPTATGEPYDMYGMTAAHPTLPLPSYARVTNVANGRSVIVRVNDRGPFLHDRVIDLSYTAAWKLGYVDQGSALVEVETIVPSTARRPTLDDVAAAAPAATRTRVTLPPAPAPGAALASEPGPAVAAVPAGSAAPAIGANEPSPSRAVPVNAVAATATAGIAAVSSSPSSPTGLVPPSARNDPPLPLAQEANGVFLQLGAFSAKENAEVFRLHVARMLPWVNDPITLKPKQGLVRVQLGPYADAIEAMAVAERIRDTLAVRPVIAR